MIKDSLDFCKNKGKNIKIAVIDSGFNYEKEKNFIVQGMSLINNHCIYDEYLDENGHGTIISKIIHRLVPLADIYSVKIFDNSLLTEIEDLISAIEWCITNDIKIINLSLGITNKKRTKRLERVCKTAIKNNCIIVASESNDGKQSYPANFNEVFGVKAGWQLNCQEYFYDRKKTIEFIARGYESNLWWMNTKFRYGLGNSFAAPIITGIVAKIVENNFNYSVQEVRKILENNSLKVLPQDLFSVNFPPQSNFKKNNNFPNPSRVVKNDFFENKKIIFFPFNREYYPIFKLKEELGFSIVGCLDIPENGLIDESIGKIFNLEKCNIKIKSIKKLDLMFDDFDILVMGHTNELDFFSDNRIKSEVKRNVLKHNKVIYCFDDIYNGSYKSFTRYGVISNYLSSFSRIYSKSDFYYKKKNYIKKLKICFFSSSFNQNSLIQKFFLVKKLRKNGYSVSDFSFEAIGDLIGSNCVFPLKINPSKLKIGLENLKKEVEYAVKTNDIVLGGSIMISLDHNEILNGSPEATISSYFSAVFNPNLIVLALSQCDNRESIYKNLLFFNLYTNCETIIFLFEEKKDCNMLISVIEKDSAFFPFNVHYCFDLNQLTDFILKKQKVVRYGKENNSFQ